MGNANGPLAGIRIVELGGVGPVPFCSMLLSDHGRIRAQVRHESRLPVRGL